MPSGIDLAAFLGSSIHEVKNHLGLAVHKVESLRDTSTTLSNSDKSELLDLQNVLALVNSELVNTLLVFRAQNQLLDPCIEEVWVQTFLEDIVASMQPLVTGKPYSLAVEGAEVEGYFDGAMLKNVIQTALFNATRYANGIIILSAWKRGSGVVIAIEDDGPGFPPELENKRGEEIEHGNVQEQNTGLGLWFAQMIAQLHRNKEEKGFIELKRSTKFGGASLQIFIP